VAFVAAILLALATPPASAGEGPSPIVLDNGISPAAVGHYKLTILQGGSIGDSDVTVRRHSDESITTDEPVYSYNLIFDLDGEVFFVDYGSIQHGADDSEAVNEFNLDTKNERRVHVRIVSSLDPGSLIFNQRIELSGDEGGHIGPVRVYQYLDADVLGSEDDLVQRRGSSAAGDLQVLLLDATDLVGLAMCGGYSPSQGLVNSTFVGFLADYYSDVEEAINDGNAQPSLQGTYDENDIPAYEHPDLGPVHGDADVGAALAWDVDPNATSAVVTACVRLIPQYPGRFGECTPGDIWPPDHGDGRVNIFDAFLAFQWALQRRVPSESGLECGDVYPGLAPCHFRWPHGLRWCPTGDDRFTLNDVLVILRVALHRWEFGCEPCGHDESSVALGAARIPGDVAPAGGDDTVDIGDVVRLLRMSVGLETPTADDLIRGDVAPSRVEGGLRTCDGDDVISVADVVMALRAAVALDQLQWPQRELIVRVATLGDPHSAGVTLTEIPAWVHAVAGGVPGCLPDDAQVVDMDDGGFSAACLAEHSVGADGIVASFTYRAAEAIDPATLTLSGEVAGADLSGIQATFEIQAR
jgi:hypothetical protein